MWIFFARHGQTDWNLLKKVQGTTDIPLNANGILQAEGLYKNLQQIPVTLGKVYCSHLERAIMTAQIVAEGFQVPIEKVSGLEEMNLGDFEGHTWVEIHQLYPKELAEWNSEKRFTKTPHGESYQMVLERLFQALDYILKDAPKDRDVLVVSHGAVIMTMIAILNDIPFEQSHTIDVENAKPLEFSMSELQEIRKKYETKRLSNKNRSHGGYT